MDEFKFIKTQINSAVVSLTSRIQSYQIALHGLLRMSHFLLENTGDAREAVDKWLATERFGICPDGFWQSLHRLEQYDRGELSDDSISFSCSPRLAHNGEAHFRMFAHRNIGPFLRDIKNQLPRIEWLYYQDRSNMSLQYPYILQRSAITPDFDWKSYHTWQSVCPENNPDREIRWTAPTIDYAGKGLILSASIPLYREDEFTGLWSIDLSMDSLYSGAMAESRISGQTNFISDKSGRLIYHPDLVREIDGTKGSVSDKRLGNIDDSLKALTLDAIPRGKILTREFLFRGKRKHYLFCRSIEEIGWIVFSLLPEESLLSEMNRKISSALSKVKGGNLTYRLDDGAGRITDMRGDVIRNFNDMAEALEAQMGKLRETQQIAIQSEKLQTIGTLTSGIAHDFNNILTSILGYTELALQEKGKNPTLDFYLQTIFSAGVRAKGLIGQILDMSRGEDDGTAPANLGELLDKELILLRAIIPSAIKIRQKIDTRLPVMANESLFHRILINLCVNASHAMPEGGELTIGIKDLTAEKDKGLKSGIAPGKYVELTVEDTGTGIPDDLIPRIFEPLFTTKPKGRGTGLGLVTVKKSVESHKGHIWVDSRLGSGTKFTLLFPACDDEGKPEVRKRGRTSRSGGSGSILLLEEEKPLGLMFKEYLSRIGYGVTKVSNRKAALDKLGKEDVDLLIMDIHLSETALKNFVNKLSVMNSKVSIMFCTDRGNAPIEEMIGAMEKAWIIYKPIDLHYLADRASQILANQENFNRSASTN